MFKNITAITTRDGRHLFRAEERGPMGGMKIWYAERTADATVPHGWELWSRTQRNAVGRAYPACTFR